MKSIFVILTVFLSSCASYKIETSRDFDYSKFKGNESVGVELVKLNDYPQGGQCFEPMLYVLTLGIIPTHCVDDYEVKIDGSVIGNAKATYMSGWIPLFLPLLPKWKYGGDPDISDELIRRSHKQ